MPRRPAPLSLTTPPTPYRPLISSHLTIPISPSIPLTPLLPPARLHQRALLPSSSSSLPLAIHPPPPHPYPWIWRCHLCHSVYQLGVTRRCLEDGHFFCSVPSPPASPVDDGDDDVDGVPQRRRKRKRRVPRSCKAEFDYLGWERCNIWRREVRVLREVDGEADIDLEDHEENKENASKGYERDGGYDDTRDCWAECDFPSECHNFRAERRRRRRQERSELEESREQEWEAVLAELEVQRLVKEMNGEESSESDTETESDDGDSSGVYENALEDEEEESDEDDGIDGNPNMMFVDIYLGDEEDAGLQGREIMPDSKGKVPETEQKEGQQNSPPSHSPSTATTAALITTTPKPPTIRNPHISWLALPTLTTTPSIIIPHLRHLADESSDAEVLFVERKRRKRISQLEASLQTSGEYKGGRNERGASKEPNSPLKMVVGVEDTDKMVELMRVDEGSDEAKKSENKEAQKRKVKLPGRRGAMSRYA